METWSAGAGVTDMLVNSAHVLSRPSFMRSMLPSMKVTPLVLMIAALTMRGDVPLLDCDDGAQRAGAADRRLDLRAGAAQRPPVVERGVGVVRVVDALEVGLRRSAGPAVFDVLVCRPSRRSSRRR